MLELSLYTIESDLANLIEMREQVKEELGDGATPEDLAAETAAIDNAIREYVSAEIKKVDNIRSFWRHAEMMQSAAAEEAKLQSARAKAWEQRLKRLKETCLVVMETIPFPAGKPKKLEGRTGSLMLKGNGGRQAVVISDESLVPDEFKTVTMTKTVSEWWAIHVLPEGPQVPSVSLIAAELERGEGVPGCSLAPRLSHVEVR